MARRLAVLWVVFGVVALFVVAGVHNMRARRATMQAASLKAMTIVKDDETAGGTDSSALSGKAAPGFTLVDVAGKKVSLGDYKGHPVVINFWATFCGPCRLEMPWFEQFTAKYKDQGLVVLGIDQDEDLPVAQVAAAAKKSGVTYPILMPDKTISKSYQLGDYLPETFYVDKNGVVVDHIIGGRSKDAIEASTRKAMGL